MAQITWNNVAAPNLGESNSLFAQAIQSLKDAGIGLKDTAKDYQTVVRNRSHAILQDYINSAKTPEELQSEAFNTGFKNLQATLANEYDPVKVNEYRDTRGDVLTKRAGDAVALKRNTLGLTTDQQAVDTNDMMNRIFTAPESERPALIAEAVKLNRFDAKGMLTNQVGNAQLTQATNANNLFTAQEPYLRVQPKLANEATIESTAASQARTRNAARELELKAQELEIARKKAESEGAGKFNFGTSPQGLITKTEENIRNFEATMQGDKAKARGDNSKNAQTWYDSQTGKTVTGGDNSVLSLDGVPDTLMRLVQGKYGKENLIKGWSDLSPSEQHTALANTYARSGLDAEWNVSDKDFEQLKGTLQNEVSAVLKGDVNKRNAYAFAQIDNLLGEVYYRDPNVSKEVVFNTLNIDKNLKSAYLKHKQEQAATAEATNNVAQAGAKPASVVVPKATLGASLNGGSAWFQPKQPQTAPVVTATAKDVQNSTYMKSPLQVVSEAVTQRPTPLLPAASQNAFKSKANNLSIDTGTGKTTPAKNPVAIPDVTWSEPVQAATLDPILAKLPQHTFVATFVPDGDTVYGTSKTHTTVGQPQEKIKCRVDSVNAPETSHKAGQPTQTYGEEAAKILQKMILNKEVSIRVTKPTDGKSNYGRDVCQIEVSGKDVSVELIRAGAAWLYPAYNHYGASGVALQEEARAAGRGLWQYPNPTNPETFSHANR